MNKTSKFLLSGAAVYAGAFTSMYHKDALAGKMPTLKQLGLDLSYSYDYWKNIEVIIPYSFKTGYKNFLNHASDIFFKYKLSESFSDKSLASKVSCTFICLLTLNLHEIMTCHSSKPIMDRITKKITTTVIDGLALTALAYIWHEDESDQGGEFVELSQNITEDGSL